MTKSEFMLECIDKVFSIEVSGNFIIENYMNLNVHDFYKTIFEDYISFSQAYDQVITKDFSVEEANALLMTFINIAKENALSMFLSSLDKIVKDNHLDYNVMDSFKTISSENHKLNISDIFIQMLKKKKKIEEETV